MKKGSRKLVCEHCGKLTGWLVPTGNVYYGLTEKKYSLHENCLLVRNNQFRRFTYCEDCKVFLETTETITDNFFTVA